MGASVADRDEVVEEVSRYWSLAGLRRDEVADMRAELAQHLEEAGAHGRSVDEVIGDRARFAESWAAERRGGPVATWKDVTTGRTQRERGSRRDLMLYGIGAVALVAAAVAAVGQGGSDVDNEIWRWLWTILAMVLGIGEIFTAGFFLLPFAIGAGVAAVLAWLNAAVLAQWLVFFGVSVFAMAYLRRFIGRQDMELQPRVGANRWVGSEGVVLHDIDPRSGSGMVRILNEEWRATSNQPILAGSQIVVVAVEGARLVVEQLES